MQKFWSIALTTLKILVRNKQTLFFTGIMPLLIMVVIGYVTQSGSSGKLSLGIVYAESNPEAKMVVETLKKIETLEITTGSEVDEKAALEDNKRDSVIVLPENFSLSQNTNPTNIIIYQNITNPVQGALTESVIQQIFSGIERQSKNLPPAFVYEKRSVQSSDIKYIDFLVYGILGMTIMQLGIFSTAFAVVEAKSKGVLKRLMATPIAPWQYILGNMVARLIISIGQSAILLIVATLIFDVHFQNWSWLIGLIILGNGVFLSLGLFISGLAKTVETVPVLANLIAFPMLLLGGVFFPTTRLPDWLKIVVEKLPIAALTGMLRDTVGLGMGFSEVKIPFITLVVWLFIALFLANTFFRLQEKE